MKMKAKDFLSSKHIEDGFIRNSKNLGLIKISDLMEEYHQAKEREKRDTALKKVKKAIDYNDSDQAEIEIDASVGVYNKHFE